MSVMATRKPTNKNTPRRGPRTGKALNLWVDARIRDALDQYIADMEPAPTLKNVVELAIRRYLQSVNRWPPKPEATDPD